MKVNFKVVKELEYKTRDLDLVYIMDFFDTVDLEPLLEIKLKERGRGLIKLAYELKNDNGRFVNFGGLLINTESLDLVVGYNANNKNYIPICNFQQVLKNAIYTKPDEHNDFDKDLVLYFIEKFKIDYGNFDMDDIVDSLVDINKKDIEIEVDSNSVLLNLLKYSEDENRVNLGGGAFNDINNSKDIYEYLLTIFCSLLNYIDRLGESLLGVFYSEANFGQLYTNCSSRLDIKDDTSYCTRYIKGLRDLDADPILMRELSSIGLGRNRRKSFLQLINRPGKDTNYKWILGALSSWSYIDVWDSISFKQNIKDKKIRLYNMLDYLKSVDRELDLYFSMELLKYGNKKFLSVLLNKLDIVDEFKSLNLGDIKNIIDLIDSYKRNVSLIRDMGGNHSRLVKSSQRYLPPFSIRSLEGSGKIVNKVLKKINKDLKVSKDS